MWKIICCLSLVNLALGLYHPTPDASTFHCANADAHGIIEFNCWGYASCVNHKVEVHPCLLGTELDPKTMTCVTEGTLGNDCDRDETKYCTSHADGFYPDLDIGCVSYYRCFGHVFVGRFLCPLNLVFNTDKEACDFAFNVVPPCGTKTAGK